MFDLFDKVYCCYYDVVRRILSEARLSPVSTKRMEEIARAYGYEESFLTIVPNLTDGVWPLLEKKGKNMYSSLLKNELKVPLTSLQKSWLKALLKDKRCRLFFSEDEMSRLYEAFDHVEPLYCLEEFRYFDQHLDGDCYDSPAYQKHFQTILAAISEGRALIMAYESRQGRILAYEAAPYQLQYSVKNNKFRLCCLAMYKGYFSEPTILNLAKIKDCRISSKKAPDSCSDFCFQPVRKAKEPVRLKISGERNSLERCMLHFANYEKHTEYDEETGCFICSIFYDLADETELLIDILSFGPVVQVIGPDSFLRQIRQRVRRQHELFHEPS